LPLLARIRFSEWDWRPFVAIVAIIVAFGASLQVGPNPCNSGVDDVAAFAASGHALLIGQNPFLIQLCGHPDPIPYGIGAVAANAVGSLAGQPGVWFVWLAVALSLIPILWKLAGEERRYVVVYLTCATMFVPIITGQIDGAANAIVPVGFLLPIELAGTSWAGAGLLAGFFSTFRFPSLLPFWGATASAPWWRLVPILLSIGIFALGVGITYVFWGDSFIRFGLLNQFHRTDFSLNEFAILFPNHWVTPGLVLNAVQLAALLAALSYVYYVRWPAIRSAALVLVVLALSTQYLSFNFLIWLVPVALLGDRARRWFWAIGFVGGVDYSWALGVLAQQQGIYWPSELLGGVVTAMLIGLLLSIWRESPGPSRRVAVDTGIRARGIAPESSSAIRLGPAEERTLPSEGIFELTLRKFWRGRRLSQVSRRD
jgi:hypothetical protein